MTNRPLRGKTREKIYDYIREFFGERGYAPTVRDILQGCAISSTAVVQHHLNVLQREGRIKRDAGVFRSIRLTDNWTNCPGLNATCEGDEQPCRRAACQHGHWKGAEAVVTYPPPGAVTLAVDRKIMALSDTHTCYYCSREGTDVNRLAVYGPRMNEPQYGYCCDDGESCNARIALLLD